ncbi:MAG: hypothetical protein PHQ19_03170 [Candidatus Krumholzibacteria bacterium]|nr:hypothetical protein [Candidatus Krumholzibacteria bacterium]
MMRRAAKTVMVLLTIGTFVSARQTAAGTAGKERTREDDPPVIESVFTGGGALDLHGMVSSSLLVPESGVSASLADTVETYDIQLEEEKGSALNAKTIAALVVVGIFIGVALYVLIGDEEEAPIEDDGGKPLPDYSRGVTIPIP